MPAPIKHDTDSSLRVSQGRKLGHNLFPILFVTFCLIIFLTPAAFCVYVGLDTLATFWVSQRCLLAIVLLPLFGMVFVFHLCLGGPSRVLIVGSLMGACVLLILLGDITLQEAIVVSEELLDEECDPFPIKAALQTQWDNAESFYTTCVDDLSTDADITFLEGLETFRMQDCEGYVGYDDALRANPDWQYLELLESKLMCKGWCDDGMQIWSSEYAVGTCTKALGHYMAYNTQWTLLQVTVFAALSFALLAAMLLFLAPSMWG
uniref:Uncharacterized protein n=1 Tax=Noctiluca scintillans TaxID=2966 RepID=A0A7S1F5P9_NOCSC|eukprot:CAMPEP_0194520782 /NCGR_PEP_ID=MMETSP0253-20130528/54896_1 /TAXON_ID=2966 /ORGANISM="Noctiluca scintillans" /LENGTH=262 /DNA_ID=CAMNT_0039365065 /DNA_START=99 /DNA_END=887 /DNA_ORIENTATION=-